MGLALTPVTPMAQARAAVTARLANDDTGFNAYLAATCLASGLVPYKILFRQDSSTFLQGKYDIVKLFQTDDIDLPAIAIYQGPAQTEPGDHRIIGSTFNGPLMIGVDFHLSSGEGESQTAFELLVSATTDALINCFNDMSKQARADYTLRRIQFNGNLAISQPTRMLDVETQLYLSTISVALRFYIAI